MRRPAPLIVGGGPAGAAAAVVMAGAGLRPVLLERNAAPHDALCGGFLSWSTARRLGAMGVDPAALGAQPIGHVRLFTGSRSAPSRLPHPCWSLSRRVLDEALLARAKAAGAEVRRGEKVVSLDEEGIVMSGGERIEAAALVLATGKHDLRGAGRGQAAADPYVGLRWRLPATTHLRALVADAVELHLFAGGYAGLAIQEDDCGNLCMAVRRSVLTQAGGDPAMLLARLAGQNAALAARIEAAGDEAGPVQAVANVPYGWIANLPATPRAFRVGDQAAVIPSLAGEGVAIALASGAEAGRAILAGMDAARFQQRFASRARLPVRAAGTLSFIARSGAGRAAMVAAAGMAPALSRIAARLSRISEEGGYSIPPG